MKNRLMDVVVISSLISQAAYAHSELVGSMPADKAMIAAAPQEVMLHFSEAVQLTALAVQKQGASKQSVGPLPANASEHFMVAVPSLSEGQYTVSWRALSDDSHVVVGEFSFMVGVTGASAAPSAAAGHMDHAEHSHGEHSEAH